MATKDVKLNVSDKEKTGTGWVEVTASDGSTKFWYKWVGGNNKPTGNTDGNGNNNFTVDTTTETFDVTFAGNDGNSYKFKAFKNKSEDPPSQITGSVAADGSSIEVTDLCTVVADYNWGATVETKTLTTNVCFEADPVISNRGMPTA